MKKILFVLGLLVMSISVSAEQALSKNLIEKYMKTVADVEVMVKKNPALESQIDDLMMLGKDGAMDAVKSLSIYPKIERSIKSAGFSGFEEFYDIGLRIMGGVFKAQMHQMPEGMTPDSFISQMESQIAQMKKQGMPESMTANMEKQFKEQLKGMKFMQQAAKKASTADVKFVGDNIEWITQVMSAGENKGF